MKSLFLALALVVSFSVQAFAGVYGDAVAAYKSGDYETALPLFKKSAESGKADAQFFMGVMYKNGEGTQQNYEESLKWYKKAANQGHITSQYFTAVMIEEGNGTNQDFSEAIQWYKKAAIQGNVSAQYGIGYIYELNLEDLKNAYTWYYIASYNGDIDGESAIKDISRYMTKIEMGLARTKALLWLGKNQ